MCRLLLEEFDNIIALDVETTGFSPSRDEVIELAAVRMDRSGRVADEFDLLVGLSGGRRLPPAITRLTGISEDMLINEGVSKSLACGRLAAMLSEPNALVVAYNAQFDLSFLYYMLGREGAADILKRPRFLDAMTVYKDRRPYPHKLSDAVAAYALETQNTHRAIDDARATMELARAMEAERADLTRYINLFGYNPKYGVSGRRISSVRYAGQRGEPGRRLYEP